MAEYKVVNATQLDADIKSIANAIRTKGGTGEDLMFPNGFVDAVGAIEGGGGGVGIVEEKDITFIDYDGTLIASYTIDEAHALSELPQPPNHDGLTFQCWNWTLDEVKQWNSFAYIGAHYATTDGKTRIHFTLDNPEYLSPSLNFYQTEAHGVKIDWGDGSEVETSDIRCISGSTSTSNVVKIQHNYTSVGDYIITLECTDGNFFFDGLANQAGNYMVDVLTLSEKTHNGNSIYYNTVTKLEIGEACTRITSRSTNLNLCNIPKDVTCINSLNCNTICVPKVCNYFVLQSMYNAVNILIPYIFSPDTISISGIVQLKRYGFYNTVGSSVTNITKSLIERIYIPDAVTSIGSYSDSYFLKEVSGCKNIVSIAKNAFANSYLLKKCTFPENITAIPDNCFINSGLQDFIIPNSVTNLGISCFGGSKLTKITIPKNVTTIGNYAFQNTSELQYVKIDSPAISFGNNVFSFNSQNMSVKRYYDFTSAIVADGVLSYTFGTSVFSRIKEGSVIMFATKEIADVAKTTTNLTAYADYIHYLSEEEIIE